MKKSVKNSFRIISVILSITVLLSGFAALAESMLRPGDSGDAVLKMQERLLELKYSEETPDGIFGEATEKALKLFQRENDLLESGILDETTCRMLFSEDARAYQPENHDIFAYTEETFAGTGTYIVDRSVTSFPMPEMSANEYSYTRENAFLSTATAPLSTFAADADTASYAQLRAKILSGEPVPAASVRVEEMLNYFAYDYAGPADGEPFGVTMELADCPWNAQTQLLLIGLQAAKIPEDQRPAQNLVFLLDVSGSMDEENKLPLVKRAFSLLLETLSPTDIVSLVTYASYDEIVLDGVPAADKPQILAAIDSLSAGGMTAGAAGIQTAYELAQKHFLPEGNNRILLATDGDLNVGLSDEGSLVKLVEERRRGGVTLSVLGFGDGNYKDNKLEALADFGNGNYHYIDTIYEARRALVEEAGATFFCVAKDVKLQLDFNPAQVKGYRLIGYENRVLSAEDFADDQVDGGEIGSGHRMTALYEIVPADSEFDFGGVESKYQQTAEVSQSGEWLTLSIRAKEPESDNSNLYSYPLTDDSRTDTPDDNFRFAAAVAEAGMLLTDSKWKGESSWDDVLSLLRSCTSVSGDPLKEEFLYMATLVQRSK